VLEGGLETAPDRDGDVLLPSARGDQDLGLMVFSPDPPESGAVVSVEGNL